MPNPIVILVMLLLASETACVPYATLVFESLRQTAASLPGPSFSQLPGQVDHLCRSSNCSEYQSLRVPRSDLLESRVLMTRRKAVSIVVPLICVLSVLLILLILKAFYLKQRRLQTIHDLPNLFAVLHKEDEQGSVNERPLPLSSRFQHATDIPSVRSRFSRQASRKSTSSLSGNESRSCTGQYPDSSSGILVGMLGSPDWETNMQRELANHQWRLRRESQTLSQKSQNRSTRYSHQSHPRSRNGTIRSQSESGSRNHSVHSPGRHASLRILHASSFGELYSDTFRNKGLRPKSFNAAIDQMSSSRSGSSIPCQANSRRNSHSSANAFSVPGSLSQRPSTIREVDTPPTLPLIQEGRFRLQVLDYGDSTPAVNVGPASPALDSSGSQIGSPGSGLDSSHTEASNTYGRLNASQESRMGVFWRQLPHFPSQPATPSPPILATPHISEPVQVNAVHIEPTYFDQLYGIVTDLNRENLEPNRDLRLVGKDCCRTTTRKTFGGYSPLTLDFELPALSDLLVRDLLDLGSRSARDAENRGVLSVKPPPRALTPELGTESLTVRGQHAHLVAEKHMESESLGSLSATVQNRHHLRVRDHVPFSLVALPPAYLRSPRSFERTVRFTLGNEITQNQLNGQTPFRHVASSLVDLSAPVRPSPLRRVASMGSVSSSRTSSRVIRATGDLTRTSDASSNSITQHSGFALTEDAKLDHDLRDIGCRETTEQQIVDVHTIRPIASNASLFLDLGGSSAGYDEEPSDLYSFGVTDFVAADHFFQHPQASSSEVIAVMTGHLDGSSDIEHVTEMHSGAFGGT